MSNQQKTALTVASAALVVGAIDHTAVTVAAPDFQRDFGLDVLDIRVLFVSFWFFDIAALLFSGRLSDAWSRQRVTFRPPALVGYSVSGLRSGGWRWP